MKTTPKQERLAVPRGYSARPTSGAERRGLGRLLGWPAVSYIAAICAAMIVQILCALNWGNNFISDEAIFALMSLHMTHGQFTPYVYGGHYLGSGESAVAAGLMLIFGPGIMVFRSAALLLFAAYLALHALFVTRLWSRRAALISLLFLAVPGFYILVWTYRPIGAFIALMLCVLGSLLLTQLRIADRRLHLLRVVGLGVVLGIGNWSHQLMLVYMAALALVFLLGSPEWAALLGRFEGWCARVLRLPARELILLALLAAGALVVLGFFSAACEPVATYARIETGARALLALGGAAVGLALFAVSARRRQLLGHGALLLGGALLGTAPQWLGWLVLRYPTKSSILPSCPTSIPTRVRLVLGDVFPSALGLLPVSDLPTRSAVVQAGWVLLLVITAATLLLWLWRTREALWAAVTLRPLTPEQRLPALLNLVIGISTVLALVGSNTVNVYGVRYLLLVWQFGTIVFAVMLAELWPRRRAVGLALTAAWIGLIILLNTGITLERWPAQHQFFTDQSVGALEQYLAGQNVRYGYADFWDGFTIDFLTQERVVVAPFNQMDRYPPYTARVGAAPVQFYLFVAGQGPAGGGQIGDLVDFLTLKGPAKASAPAFPWVLERLQKQRVVQRDRVANWDVWIVADR